MMTPAQSYLAKRQRRYPPCYPRRDGLDRGQHLCRPLVPALPEGLQAMLADGTVAVGEVGRFVPDISTTRVAPGAFVIEFTTGMMDFYYSVGRALTGVHVGHTKAGPENESPLQLPGVVELVAEVFNRWKRQTRWSWLWPCRRMEHADFPIHRSALEWIEMLVTSAEFFMLAHEFGHIALDQKLCPPITNNDEENADHYGLQFFLPAVSTPEMRRMAYGAIVFAIRLPAGLQRLGVRFSAEYPPQNKRIELLRKQMRLQSPSAQHYHESCTILVAYMDMMDDVENRIDKHSPAVLPDAERVLIRLIAELEEVARKRVPLERFVTDIMKMSEQLPRGTVQEATANLTSYYLPIRTEESYLSLE